MYLTGICTLQVYVPYRYMYLTGICTLLTGICTLLTGICTFYALPLSRLKTSSILGIGLMVRSRHLAISFKMEAPDGFY